MTDKSLQHCAECGKDLLLNENGRCLSCENVWLRQRVEEVERELAVSEKSRKALARKNVELLCRKKG